LRRILNRKLPTTLLGDLTYRIVIGVVLAIIVAYLGVQQLSAHAGRSSKPAPSASIASPSEAALVPYQVRVTGTSSDVPLTSRPWLFVQANDGDLYPQGGDHGDNVEIDRSDGSWCGYAYFGAPDSSAAGRRYALILALPSPAADRKLQRRMRTPPAGRVPHWPSLPPGFHQLAAARNVARLPDFQSKAQLAATPGCRH